jgi:undecaprenyl phosphate-alpha-L-ara4N flippase subunit ArnE
MQSEAKPPAGIPGCARSPAPAYAQLALSLVADAASELLLKRGAGAGGHDGWLGLSAMQSGWVWLGILANLASLFWWLAALRTIPLGVAFNLSGAVHVLVQLGCWLWLGETISTKRWIGILLVVAGVTVSARPAAAVEEEVEGKLEDEEHRRP